MRTESKHALFIGSEHGGKLKRPGRLSPVLVMRWVSKLGGASPLTLTAVLRKLRRRVQVIKYCYALYLVIDELIL
eukprot:2138868-Pleurochrysis_carterae.AAC.2